MKKTVLLAIVLLICQLGKAQEAATYNPSSCFTIGVLQGGGSLIGADLEIMPLSRLGFKMGDKLITFDIIRTNKSKHIKK